ncbi:MAG: helix-turn-helix domain-containing protein [Clostridia bacterium]|nr:helix-turn-helix domain-containing protein [Clostridia bacterium]
MIDKKELKKALFLHDVTVTMIAEAANVSESTVYRWLKHPEKLNIGMVELIKEIAHLDRDEFTRIFYPETVA